MQRQIFTENLIFSCSLFMASVPRVTTISPLRFGITGRNYWKFKLKRINMCVLIMMFKLPRKMPRK